MDQKSKWRLLSKRNILGTVLAIGIAVGVYLGDLWKGFGTGQSGSDAARKATTETTDGDAVAETSTTLATVDGASAGKTASTSPTGSDKVSQVVKVIVSDRSYFVRTDDGDEPSELKKVVALAKSATGDVDGIRIRIYRRLSSRTASEIALAEALTAAGITEEQTVWVVNPIDD
ncbi:MAG: hypothetical protein JSS49_17860 [Planctomycetes bacterium]|nr:hypothetical protein [Planctomycetota bacterium]